MDRMPDYTVYAIEGMGFETGGVITPELAAAARHWRSLGSELTVRRDGQGSAGITLVKSAARSLGPFIP
jgi:hypothetical protein